MKKYILILSFATLSFANELDFINPIFEEFQKRLFDSMKLKIPFVNTAEDKSFYYFLVELAGAKKRDITLNIEDSKLIISGKRSFNYNFLKKEIYDGEFKRELKLPSDVDIESIKAKFENGILEIRFNKISIKSKNITIE